jgi:NifU-like protein
MTAMHAAAANRLAHVRFAGAFDQADAATHGCSLVATTHGAEGSADHIGLTLLVDSAGVVRDARFTSAAEGERRVAFDVMCELAVGRMLIDAAAITPRMVEARLRALAGAQEPVLALGEDADAPYYVLRKALERAQPSAPSHPAGGLPWGEIGLFEKVRRIEAVLDAQVRPALASDGGGIDLVDLRGEELFVQYHGACGSCSSSVGGTLQFVQDSLNNHLGTQLQVRVSSVELEDAGMIM